MTQFVQSIVGYVQRKARARRAEIFRNAMPLGPNTRLLDLGSEDGANIAAVLNGTGVVSSNVYIADINAEAVERGHERFGFVPVVIPESGRLPFPDGFFDIVYCSSVIEHVTIPKDLVWSIREGREFAAKAWERQKEFASELRRLGKRYYVQTPNRFFPIESHTWLPLVGFLPRRLLVHCLRVTNRVWVKKTAPDWHLLSGAQMRLLFPEADIVEERMLGFVKSLTAIGASSLLGDGVSDPDS